jgi:hypothetical protein
VDAALAELSRAFANFMPRMAGRRSRRADKAYDADPFVDILTQRAITPVIPPKANRKIQRACDFACGCPLLRSGVPYSISGRFLVSQLI